MRDRIFGFPGLCQSIERTVPEVVSIREYSETEYFKFLEYSKSMLYKLKIFLRCRWKI
ncbi:hypothetical protein LEP1GSC171_0709 [Leptospira santarosai str. HAI1380]|uniref:Uncharacterized protein n=1 Tax=Leptospira santarosai str. MOR084 TaxID=1049984 RepID=A0A0E2BDT7_9LEPT|nr:hypothetical protein LEP1GSC179_2520 [Leptospira santarosai str. MOR084]EKR92270.1 hypothetical protein LEP1GSC163_2707 [Leptospira santarosai str. CBC379]EMJ47542.1 hypothetical protein LEP1GSC169_1999 [Leptospira santarosai str. HAI1349]EMO21641.1 hypothetical protein LEP1GSC168_1373 [Leptospira santarosai str. HAI134]EMO32369.1 hypothetical protein LEP1GSC175_0688 [Leptospira santarosai str. HAI821]EMP02832.1 hypothetical protein LEP1GSC171_0709 [Leptospira santarosai str. HAI1380]